MADAQKVSPSTVYNVQGSPDDYNYILKGADLILVNKQTNEEQVFLFVGNIMSLDGQVNMEFADGQSLDSPKLFQRSEMPDMDKQDEEAPEWEAVTDDSTPSEDEEGNSDEGNLGEGELLNAQAALVTDPTDDILKTQQRMFDDINKFAQEQSLSSTPDPIEKIEAQENEQDEKKEEEDQPVEEEKTDETKTDDTTPTKTLGATTLSLAESSETGAEDADGKLLKDGITSDNTPTLEGTADPNSKVKIYKEGEAEPIETVDADEHGKFTFNSNLLGDDVHKFYAEVTSEDGTETSRSSILSITVDTVNPGVPSEINIDSTTPNDPAAITLTPDNEKIYTNDSTPILKGTDGEPSSTLEIYDGSTLLGTTVVDSNGVWSFAITEALDDGDYTFTAKAIDIAGNESDTNVQSATISVKTAFSTATTIDLDPNSDSFDTDANGTNTDNITNDETLKLNITDIDATARLVKVYKVNSDGTKEELGNATYDNGNWVYEVDNSQIATDGNYTFAVEVTDVAGNTVTSTAAEQLTVEIDRTAPELTPSIDLLDVSDSGDTNKLLSRDDSLTVNTDNYTHGDNNGDLQLHGENAGSFAIVDLTIMNAAGDIIATVQRTADDKGEWDYTLDAETYGTTNPEELTFKAEISDAAGNTSSGELKVTVDNADPIRSSITIDGLAEDKFSTAGTTKKVTVAEDSITLKGEITEKAEDVIVTLYKLNADGTADEVAHSTTAGDGALSITEIGGKIYWSYDVTGLVEGETSSYYTIVEDAAGNLSKQSDTLIITYDEDANTPTPVLGNTTIDLVDTSDSGISDTDNITNKTDLEIKGTADPGATVKIFVDGVPVQVLVDGNLEDTLTADPDGNYSGTLTNVSSDVHNIYAESSFAGSTLTSKSSTMSVTVDTTDPTLNNDATADSTSEVTFAEDAGKIYINQDRPLIEGTGEKDTILTITYTNEDGTETGTINGVSVNSSGNWSYRFPEGEGLKDGTYTFTIDGQDAAGNTLAATQQLQNVIVKTDFTTGASISLDTISDSMGTHADAAANDQITNETDLKLTITNIHGDARQVTVYLANADGTKTELGTASLNADKSAWTYTVDNSRIPADGTYTFMVEAMDMAGNVYQPASSLPVIIDRTAPTEGLTIDLNADSDSSDHRNLLGDNEDNYTHGTESSDPNEAGILHLSGIGAGSAGRVNLYFEDAAGNKTLINTAGYIQAEADGSWKYNLDASTYGKAGAEQLNIVAEITDEAGNIESADLTVTVDNTDPVKSTITIDGLDAAKISHDSEGYAATVKGDALTLTGKILEGADDVIVTLYRKNADGSITEVAHSQTDGSGLLSITESDGAINWSYDVTGLEHDHKYSYYVTVEDAAGNVSDASETFTFTSDQQISIPTIALDAASNTIGGPGTVGDNITGFVKDGSGTKDTDVEFKVTGDHDDTISVYVVDATGTHTITVGGVDYQCSLVGSAKNGQTVSFDASAYENDTTDLQFIAVAEDAAGNTATSAIYPVTIDDEAPVAGDIGVEDAAALGLSEVDNETNAHKLTLTGTLEEGSDKLVVRVYDGVDGAGNPKYLGDATITNTGSGYKWSFDVGDDTDSAKYISEGEHNFKIVVEDAAGNQTTVPSSGTYDINIDTIDPVISADLGAGLDTGRGGSYTDDWITSIDENLSIDVEASEGATITVTVNGHDFTHTVTDAEAAAGKINFDISSLSLDDNTLNLGNNDVVITATDPAGNSTTLNKTLVIDNKVDTDTSSMKLAAGSDTGVSGDNATSDHTPTIQGTTEAFALVELLIKGTDKFGHDVEYAESVTADKNGNWTITPDSAIADGSYDVTAKITDIAGNTGTISLDSQLVISSNPTAPVITMTEDTVAQYFGENTDQDWVTRDSDPDFNIQKDVGTKLVVTATKANDSGFSFSQTYEDTDDLAADHIDMPANLNDGKYTFTFTTTDTYGNQSTTTKTVVIDSEYDSDDMTLAMAADSDTGETDIGVNDIILTKDSTPELSGKAEIGSKARMMIISFDSEAELNASADPTSMTDDDLRSFMETNKASLVTEVTVASDGSWVATPNLSDGDKYYKVIVVSEDKAGNVEAESISINLDTQVPEAPAINLTEDDGDVYLDSALDSITDLTPRLAGTSTTENDVTTIVTITDKSGTEVLKFDVSTIAEANGDWEYHYGQGSNNPYLQGGEYIATITSTDKAGNVAKDSKEFTILQDVAAKPTVELAHEDDTNIDNDGITSTALLPADTKLTLTGTAVAFQEVKIYDSSDNLIGTSKSGEDGVWTYDFETNPSGVNEYYVIANGKRSDNYTLNVDNSTPDPTADLKNDTGTDGDWITNDPTIEGNVEAGSTVKVSAERVYELTDLGGGNYSYTDSSGDSHTITAADKTLIDGKNYFVSTEKYTYTVDSENIKSDGSYETGELATILNGKDGQYRVTVNSTDVAGNSSNLVIPDVLDLDTTIDKPTIGIQTGDDSYLAPDADGDIVNSSGTKVGSYADLPEDFRNPTVAYDEDNITNDRNLVLTGDAEAGAKVVLSITLDGTITKYEVTADENGKWECTPGNLADGKYTASVTVTDAADNSSTSNDFSFEVDLSPTRAAYIDLVDDDDTYTNDSTPELTIIGDTGSAYVLYYVDEATGDLTAVKTGTFANAYQTYTVPDASALAEGDHSYRLVTVDKAGNVQSTDYTVHVDLTPPDAAEGVTFSRVDETGATPATINTYVEQTGNVVNINTNDNTTDLLVKTASGTSFVELVRSDGQVVASGSVNGSGNALLDLTSQDMNIIDDGSYTYTLKFYDGVGNQLDANNVTVNLVVDTTDPTVTIDMSSSSDRGFNEEIGSILTSGETFTFEGKFTEDRSINYTTEMAYLIVISNGSETWTYNSLDSANQDNHIQNITVNSDGTYHFDFVDSDSANPLDDGTYNVSIKAIDQAGNASDASSVDFQLDNNDINQTQLNMTADIVGSKRFVSLEQSHYTGDNDPLTTDTHYKYELTLHDNDGNTTQTSSGDLTEGDDIELSFRDDSSDYDYAEVKITDKAGNESESQYIDLDKSDLNYSADLGKDSDVASVKASLYVDTNNNGEVDAGDTVYEGFQDVTVSDNWSKDFGTSLTEGNYVLQLKGYNSGGTAIDSSKTEFSFSLDDMDTGATTDDIFNTDSDQDFNGAKDGAGGDTADTTSGTHTVVDVEVHHDHIDFNIS